MLKGIQSPTGANVGGAPPVKGRTEEFDEFEKFPVPPSDTQRALERSTTTRIQMRQLGNITHGGKGWFTLHIRRTTKRLIARPHDRSIAWRFADTRLVGVAATAIEVVCVGARLL